MIHSRVSWMSAPVDRSMTVSAPHSVAQRSLSTSSSMDDLTAELPMFALIFTRKRRPMIIGSSSGWLMFAGMIARPRATSDRTNSGVDPFANRDELHLRRDHAVPRVVHLRDRAVAAQRRPRTRRQRRRAAGSTADSADRPPSGLRPRRRARGSTRGAAAAAPPGRRAPAGRWCRTREAAARRPTGRSRASGPGRAPHRRTPCASSGTRIRSRSRALPAHVLRAS